MSWSFTWFSGTLLGPEIASNLWIRATFFCTSKAGLLEEKSCYWINHTRNHFIKCSFRCESPTTRTMTTCITGNLIGKVDVSAWNDVSIDLLDTKLLTFTQESVDTAGRDMAGRDMAVRDAAGHVITKKRTGQNGKDGTGTCKMIGIFSVPSASVKIETFLIWFGFHYFSKWTSLAADFKDFALYMQALHDLFCSC